MKSKYLSVLLSLYDDARLRAKKKREEYNAIMTDITDSVTSDNVAKRSEAYEIRSEVDRLQAKADAYYTAYRSALIHYTKTSQL